MKKTTPSGATAGSSMAPVAGYQDVQRAMPAMRFPVFDYLFFRAHEWEFFSNLGMIDGRWINIGIADAEVRSRVMPHFDVSYSFHLPAHRQAVMRRIFNDNAANFGDFGVVPSEMCGGKPDHVWATCWRGNSFTLWPQVLISLGNHVELEIGREFNRLDEQWKIGLIGEDECRLMKLDLYRPRGWMIENGLEYRDSSLPPRGGPMPFVHALSIAQLLGFDIRGIFSCMLFAAEARMTLERIAENRIWDKIIPRKNLVEGEFQLNLRAVVDLSSAWASALKSKH